MLTIPQSSCIDNFKVSMIKYCNFKGRARRSEFWFFQLSVFLIEFICLLILIIIIAITDNIIDEKEIEKNDISNNKPAFIIYLVIVAIFIIPNISVSIRRLHDIGKSGYFYLLNLIPLIGTLILLCFYLKDSDPNSNEYGTSTKYILPINDFSRKKPLIYTHNNENEMQEFP